MFLLINDLFRHNQGQILSFLLLGFEFKTMLHGLKNTDMDMEQYDAPNIKILKHTHKTKVSPT